MRTSTEDVPVVKKITWYWCEECGARYDNTTQALDCEADCLAKKQAIKDKQEECQHENTEYTMWSNKRYAELFKKCADCDASVGYKTFHYDDLCKHQDILKLIFYKV